MDDLISVIAEKYAEKFSSPEKTLLAEIAHYTNQFHPHAQMLSGHVQGKFLEMLSYLIKPKSILEIGTFTGYSALCLAAGLDDGGELHTIELREQDAIKAREYFSKSLHNNKIFLHIGDAHEIIPTLKMEWDIIFLDADKVSYIDYYELTLPTLKTNGLLIADNVFFHGKVLEDIITNKNATAIHAFNKYVANDSRVQQVLLTVRDGLTLIRKL
ncbi:MAG: O-methyltransferase [Ginsengibacter sp.]